MQKLALVVPLFAALASACGSAPESSKTADASKPPPDVSKQTPDASKQPDPAKPDPCSPAALGLAAAPAIPPWTPPPGCSPRGDGTNILRSDAELGPRLECSAGMNHLVDFSKYALLAAGHTLSPAGLGLVAHDDGKVVTLVTRQRHNCPGDPMPMPMSTIAWYLLPAGAERTFAHKTCTVESTCK